MGGFYSCSLRHNRIGRRGNCGTMSTANALCCWTLLLLLALFPAFSLTHLAPVATSSATSSEMIVTQESKSRRADQTLSAARTQDGEVETVYFQDTLSGSLQPLSPRMHSFFRKLGARNRRWLVGSSPPTCRMKCGICQPCKPVHVAIGSPRGVISETEYYPEVWRCQCGNKLYMP